MRIHGDRGDGPLHVQQVTLVDGADRGFAVALPRPLPWTIQPGGSIDVPVVFTPVDTGDALGTVEIASDDPDTPVADVALSNQTWMTCDDSYNATLPWKTSGIWTDVVAPMDDEGRYWYDPEFDDASWSLLGGMPDQQDDIADNDIFYRATFNLDRVVGTTQITFVGNDGVWLYVNGSHVGHWGGGWRQAGCVNVPEGCGTNYDAPPVDITPWLQAGRNTFAVMLSNGPTGYYLDIQAECVK